MPDCTLPDLHYLWQRFLHIEIVRLNKEKLGANLHFQNTAREDRLYLELLIKDFTITEALIETPRAPGQHFTLVSLPFLYGKTIYLGRTRELIKAVKDWGETKPYISSPASILPDNTNQVFSPRTHADKELFASFFVEMITCVLQAESFLYKERGFKSMEEYDAYFNNNFKPDCVHHASKKQECKTELEYEEYYLQGQNRNINLFSRHRSIAIANIDSGNREHDQLIITSHLCDSFHELAFTIQVKKTLQSPDQIIKSSGTFIRPPAPECREAIKRIAGLEGLSFTPKHKKEIRMALTGPRGCSHLGDLAMDTVRAIEEFNNSDQ